MREYFGVDGILSKTINEFEFRDEQLHMAEFVHELITENRCGIIEAGTGVGKTLAYLIPSIIESVENNKKLAISTETRALQLQLFEKDIPIAHEILSTKGIPFKYSLCLGSANYVCYNRFIVLVNRGFFQKKDIPYIDQLTELFNSNKSFTRFDTDIPNYIWNLILRESDSCSNYKCQYNRSCPFQNAKREWVDSNVLIMNHHLFFTNISSEKTYLPLFDIVIFDEAHSVDDICSEQIGFHIMENDFNEIIKTSFINNIQSPFLNEIHDDNLINNTRLIIQAVSEELNKYFSFLKRIIRENSSYRFYEPSPDGTHSLINDLNQLILLLDTVSHKIKNDVLSIEFDIVRSKIFEISENIKSFVYHMRENFVYWMEKYEPGYDGSLVLKGQPLDVSELLKVSVNSFYDSILYTSATLSINKSFNYICDRLGIDDKYTLLLNSPFNYYKQALLYMPKSNIEPTDNSYIDYVSEEIVVLSEMLNGNCLVLFTSYKAMLTVHDKLKLLCERKMHVQGDAPASVVLNNYIHDEGSLLLGTSSFWQGIDLAGDLLRGVIITRLPFNVPDRPYIQARADMFTLQGLNSFYSYHVPEAILKFKQGFGRLIRSSKDKGVIAVLDSRISNKAYGKLFIKSIPNCKIINSRNYLFSSIENYVTCVNRNNS